MQTVQSPFFHILYDQLAPVGSLGRGTHYSVLRSVQWHHAELTPSDRALFHDVAVIWDQDHDERLIEVLTRIHIEGLLPPILFVGERKGGLTVLLDGDAAASIGPDGVRSLRDRLSELTHVQGDSWTVQLATYESEPPDIKIINAEKESVIPYLAHIDVLWDLGIKPVTLPDKMAPSRTESD